MATKRGYKEAPLYIMTNKNRREACEAAVLSFFWALVRNPENEFEKAIRPTSTNA